MRRRWVRTAGIGGVFLHLALSGCGADGPTSPLAPTPVPGATAVLVGAGDATDCSSSGASPAAEATARLLDEIPGTVFLAGDGVHPDGSLEQYERCYAPNWGRHRARTFPVPGNHDYDTPGAFGYFSYFGEAAAPGSGYYTYKAGDWQIVALNSVIPLDAGSPQLAWLRSVLSSSRAACTMAIMHYPLFSSALAPHQPTGEVKPLWDVLYAEGADVVVAAHNHFYERFAPQDPNGRLDPTRGLRQFVVGTGGAWTHAFGAGIPNSEIRARVWGVIRFTLRPGAYDWEFVPVAGETFRDFGSGICH